VSEGKLGGLGTQLRRGMAMSAVFVLMLVPASAARAISAPIQISGTGSDGVLIRPTPSTSQPAVGWMPEGASPDFVCFTYGDRVEGLNVWFQINYNGVSGFYASHWDNSSYKTEAELTAKYAIPKCGTAPPPPKDSAPPAKTYSSIYFSPFNTGDNDAWSHAHDESVATIWENDWYEPAKLPTKASCGNAIASGNAATQARNASAGANITTLAGWSLGRLGPALYLKKATPAERQALSYIILIDPGDYDTLSCDRRLGAGKLFASWLKDNPSAHLVVISGDEDTQPDHSKGIQESYFNPIRDLHSKDVRSRVLTCNYKIDHYHAFFASEYWIAHRIDTSKKCPTLNDSKGRYKPQASWDPGE
jgi:hypothetical protein